jgi:hypothetical protein
MDDISDVGSYLVGSSLLIAVSVLVVALVGEPPTTAHDPHFVVD